MSSCLMTVLLPLVRAREKKPAEQAFLIMEKMDEAWISTKLIRICLGSKGWLFLVDYYRTSRLIRKLRRRGSL